MALMNLSAGLQWRLRQTEQTYGLSGQGEGGMK